MEALPNGHNNNANGLTEGDIDLEFLPLIYEIIKSIERDPTHDNTQKPRDSQDTSAKILELEKKLNQARERINQLPGIEHSQAEQLKQVENLRKQLLLKRQNENLIQKLADSYPIRRAAQLSVYLFNKATTPALESKTLSEIAEKLKKVKESAQVFRNEDIIQKLADSYPIRRAAQLSVYLFNKATTPALEFKNLTEVAEKLKKMKESIKKEMK